MPVPALILADIGSFVRRFCVSCGASCAGVLWSGIGLLDISDAGVERISSTYRSTADLGLLSSPNNASEDRLLISIPRLELRECD
jgi:hypothetical protein